MENWGLIGFRETRLLYSDSKNSPSEKQSVAFTIAHEISHFVRNKLNYRNLIKSTRFI